VPSGALGVARVFAFAAVTLGAVLLATPDTGATDQVAGGGPEASTTGPTSQPARE
jgi:hypothetical protein